MAYSHVNSKGNKYFLHRKEVQLKNGRKSVIHFFKKEVDEGAVEEVPEGYRVKETKNGMLVLAKA